MIKKLELAIKKLVILKKKKKIKKTRIAQVKDKQV